ncbi:MAG: HEAT repeat domain-containing protein [Planctomycetes bacterium]|nr:HEAT repeat domain-containing protein [Planctomycetota bacterium]
MSGRLLAGLFLVAAALSPAARAQQEDHKDDIRKLLNDGMDLYSRGKYTEAYAKFEEAFQKQPSNDLVYAFIQRVGTDAVMSMMNAPDEKIKSVGHRLLELSRPGEKIRKGKKEILGYIEDLRSDEFAVHNNARWHLVNFGPYAVRFLVPILGQELPDKFRSRVMLLLTDIGTDGSLAVAEALNSKNAFLRQNAAIVLGNIKDDRAVPALRRVHSNPNELPEVKKLAHEALIKITRKGESNWKDAADYYFELAEYYYYGYPSVIHAWNRAYLIWRWDEERDVLTEREVPRFAFNEQLAEEALYDCLSIRPDYRRDGMTPWGLLACTHFQQAIEAEAALEAAEYAQKVGEPGLLPDHVETLKGMVSNYNRHNVSGRIPGKSYLYEGLSRCIKDSNAPVAVALLRALKQMARPEDLPEEGPGAATALGAPLVHALADDDKRVRYAAAEAYVAINPKSPKLGMPLVIPNLVDALGESDVRIAMFVYDVQTDEERSFVNGFRRMLVQANCFPVVATSGQEAIIKAKQFPTEDVIIIQKKIAGQIYFQESETRRQIRESVFDALRDDVRTKHIPRIILGENATDVDEAKRIYDQTAQGFLSRTAQVLELKALLDQVFSSPEAQKDSKARADALARSAAETLASIDPTNTHLPYPNSIEGLIRTVNPDVLRNDSIRVPAARALGRFGDQRAIDVLVKTLSLKSERPEEAEGQKPVRLECAKALAEIFRQVRVAPSKEGFDALKKQLVDGDYEIEAAVGEALGNAELTPEQRLEAENVRRINTRREAATPEDE